MVRGASVLPALGSAARASAVRPAHPVNKGAAKPHTRRFTQILPASFHSITFIVYPSGLFSQSVVNLNLPPANFWQVPFHWSTHALRLSLGHPLETVIYLGLVVRCWGRGLVVQRWRWVLIVQCWCWGLVVQPLASLATARDQPDSIRRAAIAGLVEPTPLAS